MLWQMLYCSLAYLEYFFMILKPLKLNYWENELKIFKKYIDFASVDLRKLSIRLIDWLIDFNGIKIQICLFCA